MHLKAYYVSYLQPSDEVNERFRALNKVVTHFLRPGRWRYAQDIANIGQNMITTFKFMLTLFDPF